MDKKDRKQLFDKYNGRCGYCGTLLKKGWHVSKILSEGLVINDSGSIEVPNDNNENKMPSCPPCNMSRTRDNSGVTFKSIEDFRKQLQDDLEFIQSFPYYQRALRFGLITETNKEIKFYFETLQPTHP